MHDHGSISALCQIYGFVAEAVLAVVAKLLTLLQA